MALIDISLGGADFYSKSMMFGEVDRTFDAVPAGIVSEILLSHGKRIPPM